MRKLISTTYPLKFPIMKSKFHNLLSLKKYRWLIFCILIIITLFIPSFNFGFDGYFVQEIAKSQSIGSNNTQSPYDVAYFLFGTLQKLYAWQPDMPWITIFQQAMWLYAFGYFSIRIILYNHHWYPLLLVWTIMLPFWVYSSVVQNGFWLAVAGGSQYMFTTKSTYRIFGLVFFIIGLLWRDLSALLALVSLGAGWVYLSTNENRWRTLVHWAVLFIILLFFFRARIMVIDPQSKLVNDYFTICNDYILCDRSLIDIEDRKQFGLFLDNWMIPDHSEEELAKLTQWVKTSTSNYRFIFSKNRWDKIKENHFAEDWLLPNLLIVIIIFSFISILQLQNEYGTFKIIIAILPLLFIYILRPYTFWMLAIIGGFVCLYFTVPSKNKWIINKWFLLLMSICLLISSFSMRHLSILDIARNKFIENWKPEKYKGNLIVDLPFLFTYSGNSPSGNFLKVTHNPQQKVFCYFYLPGISEDYQVEIQKAGGFVNWIQLQSNMKTTFIGSPLLRETTLTYLACKDTHNVYWFEKVDDNPIINVKTDLYSIILESHILKYKNKKQY